ncbi:MAG TPA: DUF2889 domain-containing protein [Desulfosporosinus sp.]|nr:DUF2889 domain-containing protein [Desulfosporosinus sp.]
MYLFNRNITVNVRTEDEKTLTVEGVFLDSHHELCITLEVDLESYKITSADGELRRVPHLDCKQTQNLISNLVGIDLNRNVRKQILLAVGLNKGCTHLTDLTLECVKGLIQARFHLMRLRMPALEIKGIVRQYLAGSCLHFKKKI